MVAMSDDARCWTPAGVSSIQHKKKTAIRNGVGNCIRLPPKGKRPTRPPRPLLAMPISTGPAGLRGRKEKVLSGEKEIPTVYKYAISFILGVAASFFGKREGGRYNEGGGL